MGTRWRGKVGLTEGFPDRESSDKRHLEHREQVCRVGRVTRRSARSPRKDTRREVRTGDGDLPLCELVSSVPEHKHDEERERRLSQTEKE